MDRASKWNRRLLLKTGVLGLTGAALARCGGATSPTPGQDAGALADSMAADASDPSDVGQSADASGGADAGAGTDAQVPPTCGERTAANIEGPFFLPNSPERSNIRATNTAGVLLTITGRVLDGDCAPLSGVLVDFWQADESGAYDNVGTTYRGHQLTAPDGTYRLETIIPGRYLNGAQYRPAHVHVKVQAIGFPGLTTQLYFEGDPFNSVDPFIDNSLIMAVTDVGAAKACSFDFVMA